MLYKGCKLNCAVAYTMLGEFDNAKEYLVKLNANFDPIGSYLYDEEWVVTPSMMGIDGYTEEAMELYLTFSSGYDRITIKH